MAIKFAIKSFLPQLKEVKHVQIMCDNTTAISYINKQGGTHNMDMNCLAVEIWEYFIGLKVHLSATHILGIHNTLADTTFR